MDKAREYFIRIPLGTNLDLPHGFITNVSVGKNYWDGAHRCVDYAVYKTAVDALKAIAKHQSLSTNLPELSTTYKIASDCLKQLGEGE